MEVTENNWTDIQVVHKVFIDLSACVEKVVISSDFHLKDRRMLASIINKANFFTEILSQIKERGDEDSIVRYSFDPYITMVKDLYSVNFLSDGNLPKSLPYKPSMLDMVTIDYALDTLIFRYYHPPQIHSFWKRLLHHQHRYLYQLAAKR